MRPDLRACSAALMAVALWAACSGDGGARVAGGGGLETTGGGGRIVDGAGPAAGARVRLVPADFRPREGGSFPDSLTAFTDGTGGYAFKDIAPGAYNLEARRASDGVRLFQGGVTFRVGARNLVVTDTLREPGAVRLHWDGARSGYAFLPGTTWFRKILRGESDTGAVILDSLPAGGLPALFFADSLAQPSPRLLVDTLKVIAGAVVDRLSSGLWAHAGRWTLGAAPGEAAATLVRYPALLRLTAANFDFGEAATDGRDLRFTAASGAPLDFEIERWDSSGRKAEIWVALDSLGPFGRPGNHRQFMMLWGRGDAPPAPRGRPVFDTARGYVGVWHLSETSVSPPRRFKDATATALQGLGTVVRPDSSGLAPIAGAQSFDGEEGYIRTDDGPLHWGRPLMASVWLAPDFSADDAEPRTLLAQWEEKDSTGFRLEFAPDIDGLRFALGLSGTVHLAEARDLGFAKGERHLAAMSFDGTVMRLHWDGVQVASTEVPAGNGSWENARDFLIGALGDVSPEDAEIRYFLGALDEVRVHRDLEALPALPLDHALQAPGSAILRLDRIR